MISAGPLAFSGTRLGWADLPRPVRARIAELAGADVVSETTATSGFSPGYAATLDLGDGTSIFLKAVSADQNPGSPELARAEARVHALLPEKVPTPRLLWSHDDGTWVLLAFAVVGGRAPELPWQPDDLARALDALAALGSVPAPAGLPCLTDLAAVAFTGWRRLAGTAQDLQRALVAAGPHDAWVLSRLGELVEREAAAVGATAGSALVHADLRADNLLLDEDVVWVLDWPNAAAGAPWFDLLTMLPSVAMQGGGDPQALFWGHPSAAAASRHEVGDVLTAVTGHLLLAGVQPSPPGIPNLRPFQRALARAALDWLVRVPAADLSP